MPDLVTHYVFSYLIASRVVSRKKAFILAVVGLLPDLDALFRIHRWFTHSIFLTILAGIILIMLTYLLNRRYVKYAVVISAIYSIHLLMDLFMGFTPILWPLLNESYSLSLNLNATFSTTGVNLYPHIIVNTEETSFIVQSEVSGPLFSDMSIIVAIGIIATVLMEDYFRGYGVSK